MRKVITAVTCLGIALSFKLQGQDMKIPLGTMPMIYNGGFAGEGEHPRINTGGYYSWRTGFYASPPPFFDRYKEQHGYFASYDQFIPALRSGIGFTLRQEHFTDLVEPDYYKKQQTQLTLCFSPKLSFNGKYTFAPFLDLNFIDVRLTPNDFPYYSRFEGNSLGIRTGFLLNSKKFYTGIAVHMLENTVRSQLYGSYYFSRGNPIIFQAGYTFQKKPESRFSFTPHLAVELARPYDLQFNLMFRYKKFIWSLSNQGLGLGMQQKNFRILATYGFYNSRRSSFIGSLSFRYLIK